RGSLQNSGEDRTQQSTKSEVEKIDDSRRSATELRRICFLDYTVRQHRRARSNSRNETKHIGRKDVRVSVEYPRQTSKQHNCAADDHRLAPANPVWNKNKQLAAAEPPERNRSP